ncbi:MAG: hypothetical protein ITG01_04910 [Comamonas sp.]|nr:hypothetical protein [Comamonas sp.]
MAQDQDRQTELKKMELCEACAGIQRNWRKTPGHAELAQGTNYKRERSTGMVTITRYVCERCGTNWEYENDKKNLHAGWSLTGRRPTKD